MELDDAKIERAIRDYAKRNDNSEICYFANRLYKRIHHKVVFDPPYVHYNGKDEEQSDAYHRITYVNQNIRKEYANSRNVYVDLAKGSTAKHIFDIKIYTEESDPDYKTELLSFKEMPAIPIISKHDGSIKPIQDYSFTLRSISDRKISILRVYAEETEANELQEKCINWFTVEYTTKIAQLEEAKEKKAKLKGELDKTEESIKKLQEDLNTSDS